MEATFFSGVQVRIKIGSPTRQESTGRICLPLTMPLDDGTVKGWPDWVSDAYAAMKSHAKKFIPDLQQVADIMVLFHEKAETGKNLFAAPEAKFPHAELKNFAVVREGDPDDFDIVLKLTMYSPFARDSWAWLGEMAGNDCYMGFPRDLEKTGGAIKQGSATQEALDLEADRREACKPEHDAEFARGAVPDAPTMESATGEPEPASGASSARRRGSKSIQ